MNCLLARVKDRKEKYRKVITRDFSFYECPENLSNNHEYTPSYKLENDEWYSISDFSKKEFCNEFINNELDTTAYRVLDKAELCDIIYLCAKQDDIWYFQRVFKHSVLEKKRAVFLGDEITVKKNLKQIILSDIADAMYIINDDKLYFRKLETIAPIFRGIDSLYREATNDEISGFLEEPFIQVGEEYGVEKVGKANRQRIAMVIENFNHLEQEQKSEIFLYTNQYYPQLEFDGTVFTIRGEDDMKYLLYGLEQRYYTTPATNEKRIANSVRSIPENK